MTGQFALVEGQRTPLTLAMPPVGKGGEADVFRTSTLPDTVVKIYHRRHGVTHANRAKLQAMIERPPEHLVSRVNGRVLPVFAWPTHIVEDAQRECAGFLMPEIPLQQAATLQVFMSRTTMSRALSKEDCCLPRRVQICRNLASAIAEIHRQHHYCVDIKPQNIYLFKDTGIVCLVDNDSFAISGNGGERFTASAYSPEYVAPELLNNNLAANSVCDDRQDRFALAVLMFRLLDNGLHPFQGIPGIDTDEWNIDFCIRQGYYPHGTAAHASIKPSASSTYDLWDEATRQMFDRAFTSTRPSERPSAAEWRNHFDQLQRTKGTFVRCSKASTDVLHIHFAGRDCPECRLESMNAGFSHIAPPPAPAPAPTPTAAPLEPLHPLRSGALGDHTPLPAPDPSNRKWLYVMLAAAFAGVMVLWIVNM
jgi:DNA-binding helix-hairpin-helix protein with protein kinase domain